MSLDHAVTCPLDCPDACGVLVETAQDGSFQGLRGNPAHSWSKGFLCGKTMLYGDLVTHAQRLRAPLVREGARLVETTWDRALGIVAHKLGALRGEDVLALWYGGSMGLVQRRFPLRMMHALGATLHDGGVCDATGTIGCQLVLGECVGPDIEAVEESDLLLVWGADVARTMQHLVPRMRRMQQRGVPLFVVDVYATETMSEVRARGGTGLVIRPGTDAALLLALARDAFEHDCAGAGEVEGWRVDRGGLARTCVGAEAFEAHVRAGPDLVAAATITGAPLDSIHALRDALRRSRTPFLKAGVGFTRRRNGAMSMRALASLAAVLGHADRLHFESFDHFGLAEEVVQRPALRPLGATRASVRQVEVGRHLDEGRFRAVVVWCHDPAVTLPESTRFRRGFARDDLFTVVHEHFLTDTAELADVVLPATMFVEHADVYRSYGQRVIQFARAAARAPEGPRSNVDTFAALARRMDLPPATWDVTAEDVCLELLEASRSRFSDAEYEQVLRGEPVKLAPRSFAQRATPSGRIELVSGREAAAGRPSMATYVPDDGARERGAFQLICAPSVHTHNSTYGRSPRHRRKEGPPRVGLNPDDALSLGLVAGDPVTLVNDRARLTLRAELDPNMPTGLVRVDGLPSSHEVPEGTSVNALVSDDVSDLGDGNVLYSTRVDLVSSTTRLC